MERNPGNPAASKKQDWASCLCKLFDDVGEVLLHFKLMLFHAFLLFSFAYALYMILISARH